MKNAIFTDSFRAVYSKGKLIFDVKSRGNTLGKTFEYKEAAGKMLCGHEGSLNMPLKLKKRLCENGSYSPTTEAVYANMRGPNMLKVPKIDSTINRCSNYNL